jgi:YHS domain-containing protein
MGLDGYCPVHLAEKQQWVPGNRQWGVIHRGRTYLFASPACKERFLTEPDRFSPILSGNDPVVAVDQGQIAPGRREHGVFFSGQIVLFASESSLERFYQNPDRYAAAMTTTQR